MTFFYNGFLFIMAFLLKGLFFSKLLKKKNKKNKIKGVNNASREKKKKFLKW